MYTTPLCEWSISDPNAESAVLSKVNDFATFKKVEVACMQKNSTF